MTTPKLTRRLMLGGLCLLAIVPSVQAASLPAIAAYRNPGCGCCEKWAELLKAAGFAVTMEDDPNLEARRNAAGVPADIAGCHTAFMGYFIIEGHVPVEDIMRLIAEKPMARGLAVPGMPIGSPGMETDGTVDAFEVLAFKSDGTWSVFAKHGQM